MTRCDIFSEETMREIDRVRSDFEKNTYFEKNYNWCRQLLAVDQDASAAACAIYMGMEFASSLGLCRDMLPLYYIDRMLPDLEQIFEKKGLGAQVMKDSLKDVEIWTEVYRRTHNGKTGLDRLNWVFRSLSAKVIRFGSLQFELTTYEFPFRIFRKKDGKQWKALAESGLFFDREGYLCGTNGGHRERWKESVLRDSDGLAEGYEADLTRGRLLPEQSVQLYLDEWELLLAKGQPAVAVHIPEGTDLGAESVDGSFREAKAYYEKKHISAKVLICDSWLLDPHLKEVLDREGRICRFMERFFKMPLLREQPQILERVMGFDFRIEDLETYPCRTSLQVRVRDYLKQGNEFFTTAGFLPWE